MLKPALALVVAVLLFGCGGPDCGFEDGTYLTSHLRVNGDCPDMESRLIAPRVVPPECTQSVEYEDECNVSVVRSCEVAGARVRAVVKLAPQGNGYAGNVQYTLLSPDPGVSCSGLYSVTYTAQ
jgi:hypothetical protein